MTRSRSSRGRCRGTRARAQARIRVSAHDRRRVQARCRSRPKRSRAVSRTEKSSPAPQDVGETILAAGRRLLPGFACTRARTEMDRSYGGTAPAGAGQSPAPQVGTPAARPCTALVAMGLARPAATCRSVGAGQCAQGRCRLLPVAAAGAPTGHCAPDLGRHGLA